jgi:DNA topoisomerase I
VSSVDAERDESRLYDLIWKRAIASQMADAKLERTTIKIGNEKLSDMFQAKGEVILFDGFLKGLLWSLRWMMKKNKTKADCYPKWK